jgi:hypothetical protein
MGVEMDIESVKTITNGIVEVGKIVGPALIGKQGDGSLFDNPRLPLAKQTFIGRMIMPGKR